MARGEKRIVARVWQLFNWSLARGHKGLMVVLIAAGVIAAYDVNRQWAAFPVDHLPSFRDTTCVTWLRAQNLETPLVAWRSGYDAIFTFLDNRVRKFNVEVAYTPLPLPSTIGEIERLRFTSLPEYAMPWFEPEQERLRAQGYMPVASSPIIDGHRCLWRKADALPYAYTVSIDDMMQLNPDAVLDANLVSPVTALERRPDEIALIAPTNMALPLVLTVQEIAYPGWQVEVAGRPAALEVLGGQIAVRVHAVYFAFRPPMLYLGAAITLVSCGICVLILLRSGRKSILNGNLKTLL
jgi:hypothetical protein